MLSAYYNIFRSIIFCSVVLRFVVRRKRGRITKIAKNQGKFIHLRPRFFLDLTEKAEVFGMYLLVLEFWL